MPAYVGLVGLP